MEVRLTFSVYKSKKYTSVKKYMVIEYGENYASLFLCVYPTYAPWKSRRRAVRAERRM
jgi:hypothetical protein